MADNTKYKFEGKEYGKGRLVHAVIKPITSSTGLTIEALIEQFSAVPFNGDIIVSLPAYEERLKRSADTERRYFVNDALTDVTGETFYVSNQWGIGNIDGFIIRARELGASIDIIADPNSEVVRFYKFHKENAPSKWIDSYSQRSKFLSAINVNDFDFSNEDFLENYWRSNSNGIAGIGSGMLSHEDFENLRDELPDISRKIINSPTAETYADIMQWAKDAKAQGKTKFIRKGVIRRFFCACDPESLSTMLKNQMLKKFVKRWNADGYGSTIETSDNWVELNSRIMRAVKMRGLENEDTFLVNTFVYRLGEFLSGDNPAAFGGSVVNSALANPGSISGSSTVSASLNQILYGPPGTGKTYNTIERAVAIIDPVLIEELKTEGLSERDSRVRVKNRFDELVRVGQIAFTTFHQNFSYEDFVEGLKAESDGGQISYSVEDGIFKKICEKADPVLQAGELEDAITDLKEKCSEEPLKLKTLTGKTFSLSYRGGKTFRCMPQASNADRDLPANIDHVRKMARGETPENLYCGSYVKSIAQYLRETYNIDAGETVVTPTAVPHVLIIDEINRGNIAKIFGELITLLEPGKRKGQSEALTLTLPYSKEPFSVPANLHVIGTMNTADTNLAKVDIALRRRFEFVEMMPKAELLEGLLVEGVDLSRLLETINQRIELLYDRDHCIGHSYFMGLSSGSSIADLALIFEKQIIPLLEEYFFDDWSLIHRVLGDHLKGAGQPKFIVRKYTQGDMQRLLGPDWKADASVHTGWQLNREALTSVGAYQGSYAPSNNQDVTIEQADTDELDD